MATMQSRRHFLATLSLAGAGGLWLPESAHAVDRDQPPETRTIRLPAIPAACTAPLYLAREFLLEEGFLDVQYVPTKIVSVGMLAAGELDLSMEAGVDYLPLLDEGQPLTLLAGVSSGCMELVANDSVRSISDLPGRRVGIGGWRDSGHLLVSAMAAYVGIDPVKEIQWVVADSSATQADLFTAGQIDAFIGVPPDPNQPCFRHLGHVVVNIGFDRPWSQYYCCMAVANADYVRNYPIATKRALRAILRATDLCHERPQWVAQQMVDIGFSPECAQMAIDNVRYDIWREYNPEDSIRFYSLLLQEVGMTEMTPNEVISRFADWSFLDKIRSELIPA